MNKVWKYFILFALLGALMCTAAFAADEVTEPTFTDPAEGAVFTLDSSGEKFDVTYSGATSGQHLILMVAEGDDGNYTINETSIQYVNQDAADSEGISFTVYPANMVNAKIMLSGFEDGPVVLGYLKMPKPKVTVELVGVDNSAETNVSTDGKTLNVQNDQTCVVLYTADGGATYETLEATQNADGGYDYDLTKVPSGAVVSVAIKGDTNCDGVLDSSDYGRLNAVLLGRTTLSAIGEMTADANGDGLVDSSDYGRMNAVLLGRTSMTW